MKKTVKMVFLILAFAVISLLGLPVYAQEPGKGNGIVSYQFNQNGETSIWYVLGVLAGVMMGVAMMIVIMKIIHKMGGRVQLKWDKKGDSYDERQKLARGIAYKWAFFTMLSYVIIVSLLSEFKITGIFMSFGGMWIGVCCSLAVFVIICILRDAYMSLYENARGVSLLFCFVCLMNLICGIRNIVNRDPFLENGVISTDSINMIAAILFAVILVVFAIRVLYNSRHIEEED